MYSKYIVLFAILLTGYVLRKINFLDDKMNHGLNKFIIYFAYPCMIIYSLGTLQMSGHLLINFLLMLGLTIACFAVCQVYVYFYYKLRKIPREISHLVEFSTVCPNDGFMGFPVAQIFFGPTGLFFMLAHNAGMNFFIFTYGMKLIRRNKEGQRKNTLRTTARAALKVLLNPNILALLVGLAISITKLKMPAAIDEYLLQIGRVAAPMAMIFIGATLANCKLSDVFKKAVIIESTINKLIFLPILTFVLVIFLPVAPIIKAMLVLGCCFPAAATVSMLAEQEGEDQSISSKILFLSTVLSLVTIPLSVKFINFFIM